MSDILSWIRVEGPFLIGHRGYAAEARENTPPAFEAALEAGCDGVELDARMSRDGVALVHHDAEARSSGQTLVLADRSFEALRDTRFEGRGGPYRIHSLTEVLRGLAGRCLINVEAKPAAPEFRQRTAAAIYEAVEKVRPRESVLVSSFDPELLLALHRYDNALALGFLFASLKDLNHLEDEPVVDLLTSIHPRHNLVDAKLMRRAAERGLQVHAWTADDPAEIQRLMDLGVTAVITNRPIQS